MADVDERSVRDGISGPAKTQPGMLQSIQICRGVASLLVVLFHLGAVLAIPKYFGEPIFHYIFVGGGPGGVDIFFVLSGFIITSVHWQDIGHPARLPAYLYKRCVRIYPVYWIVFVGVSIVALQVPGAADGIPRDLGSLSKAIALLPQDPSVVGGTGAPVIIVAWSLQYEMIFYAIFGLLILNRLLAVAVMVLLVAWAVGWLAGAQVPLGFLRLERFVLFAAGLLVGLAARAKWWTAGARSAVVVGVVGFLATAAMVSLSTIFPQGPLKPSDAAVTLIFGAFASFLIFGLVTLERQGWRPTWEGGLLLGDASYVLYLIHFPIISVVCKIAYAKGLAGLSGAALAWTLALAVCIAAAVLFHVMIERPLMAAARGLLERPHHPASRS